MVKTMLSYNQVKQHDKKNGNTLKCKALHTHIRDSYKSRMFSQATQQKHLDNSIKALHQFTKLL